MAEGGIIMASLSTLDLIEMADVSGNIKKLETMMTWLEENLQEEFAKHAPGVIADYKNQSYLMGHSAGGSISTGLLLKNCYMIKGVILIDPTDQFFTPVT